MRMSELFGQSLRKPPAEVETACFQFLIRAGFLRQVSAGLFAYLPLAKRVLFKLEEILKNQLEAIGGQEVSLPRTVPVEVLPESENAPREEAVQLTDRSGRRLVLAGSQESLAAGLARSEISSYRQLPRLIYQFQTTWQGSGRMRERLMAFGYSFDANPEGLSRQYRSHYEAFDRILRQCGLPAAAAEADPGLLEGGLAHEFNYPAPWGEESYLVCRQCGYRANRRAAGFRRVAPETEEAKPLEKVATPGATTIASLCECLDISPSRTAKAVFLIASIPDQPAGRERFVVAVIRGDMELNEVKLARAIGASRLRLAQEEEIRKRGIEPGYGSPVGIRGAQVVADELIPHCPNLVAGANEEGFHLLNVNLDRDYRADITADLVTPGPGYPCPKCGASLEEEWGVKIGSLIKLGAGLSDTVGCTFQDREGGKRSILIGLYALDLSSLLSCIAEEHHDEQGLIWPPAVAPFDLYLLSLTRDSEVPDRLYRELESAGVRVLYDERNESAGVKFADADLIGIPLRLTVGDRSLKQGGVELKRRDSREKLLVPLEEAVQRVLKEVAGGAAAFEQKTTLENE